MRVVHGLYKDANGKKSRLYSIWEDMKHRCLNPKNKRFHRYGGRGITFSEEWSEYKPFYNWAMANGYAETLTLDRKDSDGNYDPGNCKFSTMKEQGNNRSTNRLFAVDGITKTMKEWATEYGHTYATIRHRLKRGWDINVALKTPNKKQYEA